MTAEDVLCLHTEGVNRALRQQDYAALEKIYSDIYMLVRPDGAAAGKQDRILAQRQASAARVFSPTCHFFCNYFAPMRRERMACWIINELMFHRLKRTASHSFALRFGC